MKKITDEQKGKIFSEIKKRVLDNPVINNEKINVYYFKDIYSVNNQYRLGFLIDIIKFAEYIMRLNEKEISIFKKKLTNSYMIEVNKYTRLVSVCSPVFELHSDERELKLKIEAEINNKIIANLEKIDWICRCNLDSKIRFEDAVLKGRYCEHAENPREWDNFGKVLNLGVRQNSALANVADESYTHSCAYSIDEAWKLYVLENHFVPSNDEEKKQYNEAIEYGFDDDNDLEEKIDEFIEKEIVELSIYLYDHGNVSFKTTPYGCSWDSGVYGIIYITKENIKKEYGVKEVTDEEIKAAVKIMEEEIKFLSTYIAGEVVEIGIKDKYGEWFEDYNLILYDSDPIAEAKKYLPKSFWPQLENLNFEIPYY